MQNGSLYVVATPIGNLDDITLRALETLRRADCILAEDTRHSQGLLNHYGISAPLISLHEHNEEARIPQVIAQLKQGQSMALISDAGTPLVSDPGYRLVQAVIEVGIAVIPLPGACALIAALSASGLATDSFRFVGFLPARSGPRQKILAHLSSATETLIFYESPHRILDSLTDMNTVWGASRSVVLARELTKTFETFLRGSLEEVLARVVADPDQQKGEIVLIIEGKREVQTDKEEQLSEQTQKMLSVLLRELPLKQAVQLTSEITGEKRNQIYDWALKKGA